MKNQSERGQSLREQAGLGPAPKKETAANKVWKKFKESKYFAMGKVLAFAFIFLKVATYFWRVVTGLVTEVKGFERAASA
jgi:hypothetical protein